MFKPRFFETIRNYSFKQFVSDLTAGIIVGIVAIPLAIAFTIASGVSPDKGLVTAIIAGFIISMLGGSNVQIGGPTGAFIVIVYGIVQKYGLDGLIIATIMAGIILILMGVIKLGTVIQFIPHPVIVGFTSGIALIIFTTQINDLFGLGIRNVPADFIGKWGVFITNFSHVNYWALLIGIGTILLILLVQKINAKIPGALVALVLSTFIVWFFKVPVETIGARFGEFSSSVPMPKFPAFSFDKIRELISPAFTIAILAGIESLLSAVVADGMIGGKKHDSNTELIAQGIANIGSGLFGGIPATGAIARTATNVKNGGRTPVAGMTHAIVLLLVLLFLGKLASLIPLACLAGILIIVSYNMSEWKTFKALLQCSKSDIIVLITTFSLTVIFDLTVAIWVGIVLALFLFMRRMHLVSNINIMKNEFVDEKEIDDPFSINKIEIPEGVEVYEINGPFFFGAAEKFKDQMLTIEKPPKIRILSMRFVPTIDSSGIKLLEDIYKDSKKHKTVLILSHVNEYPMKIIKKTHFDNLIGDDNIKNTIQEALERARIILGINEPTVLEKIKRGGIHYNISGKDPFEIINSSINKITFNPKTNVKNIKTALLEREEMMFTGVGSGVAIPHPRNPALHNIEEEVISICFFENEVNYNSFDGIPVHTAIFIISSTAKSHLETLSKIAKLCTKPEFIDMLKNKMPQEEILKFIEQENI
jgi:sulfate permease, SulP family